MSESLKSYVIKRYSDICSMPELMRYYGQTNFMNFGYWDDDTRDQKQACEKLMDRLLSLIPDKSGNILDVACGKGETTRYLTRYYPPEQVTAINISEEQLNEARKTAPGCDFRLMDATELNFGDASIDNIISVEAIFHFNTREKFLKEACRVLKHGGRLVISDILMTLEGERRRQSRTEKNFVKDLDEYREIFKRAGFAELELVDVTEQCWRRHFWYAVTYFHERFFTGGISRKEMEGYLHETYRRVPDVRYYLLASARKA